MLRNEGGDSGRGGPAFPFRLFLVVVTGRSSVMSSQQDELAPPVQEEVIPLSREDFEELCKLASPQGVALWDPFSSDAPSSSVKQSFVRPGLQKQFEFNTEVLSIISSCVRALPEEHQVRTVLKKAGSLLAQRNEILVVADKDPGIWEFYEKRSKAESFKTSNPILAEYFKEKKKEDRKGLNPQVPWKRTFHPYPVRGQQPFRYGGAAWSPAPPSGFQESPYFRQVRPQFRDYSAGYQTSSDRRYSKQHQMCYNCGTFGHFSSECRAPWSRKD